MVEILVVQQQVLDDRLGGLVRLPAAQLQGEERIAGGVHLAALALALPVVVAVAVEEGGNVFGLPAEVVVA